MSDSDSDSDPFLAINAEFGPQGSLQAFYDIYSEKKKLDGWIPPSERLNCLVPKYKQLALPRGSEKFLPEGSRYREPVTCPPRPIRPITREEMRQRLKKKAQVEAARALARVWAKKQTTRIRRAARARKAALAKAPAPAAPKPAPKPAARKNVKRAAPKPVAKKAAQRKGRKGRKDRREDADTAEVFDSPISKVAMAVASMGMCCLGAVAFSSSPPVAPEDDDMASSEEGLLRLEL
jgi:hypothetical protein